MPNDRVKISELPACFTSSILLDGVGFRIFLLELCDDGRVELKHLQVFQGIQVKFKILDEILICIFEIQLVTISILYGIKLKMPKFQLFHLHL